MLDPSNSQMHLLTIERLMEEAAGLASKAGDSASNDTCNVKARVCLDIAQIKLVQAGQALKVQQIDLTREANGLSEKLLKSNENASIQSEQNAKALNEATVELARSTTGLKRATWILAIFTGIQVILAIVNFYISLHASKP